MKQWTHIYLIGIGGIGMSALARWAKHTGKEVAGYDRTPTTLTQQLAQEGMDIHYEDDWDQIPAQFKQIQTTLVLITPAIPKDHSEWKRFQELGFTIQKRSELLGQISKEYFTIAVAGTHGKTSTCALIAYILHQMGRKFIAFLGGIAKDFDSNFVIREGAGEMIAVIEADEFDRSFLSLHPNVAVITAVEADHLDIYGTEANVIAAFRQFADQVINTGGMVIAQEQVKQINTSASYGTDQADYKLTVSKIENGISTFKIKHQQELLISSSISLFSAYSLQNLCGAISAISTIDRPRLSQLKDLTTYKAVKRRMETHIATDQLVYIDDYAHHPTELNALLDAIREAYQGWKIHAIFQPHLFSRTRDFQDGFGQSLSKADSVRILPIYPARELPIEGVDAQLILDRVTVEDKAIISKQVVQAYVGSIQEGVILTIGSGDIDQCVTGIVESLSQRT